MSKKLLLTGCLAALQLTSLSTIAKVSSEEAEELGKSLTPMGAVVAANADGTIPAFTGVAIKFPQSVYDNPSKHLPNPFANEEPRLIISAENYQQHLDKLSAGNIIQFEKYPETFKMKVYPTHRTAVYSEFINQSSIDNAGRSTLVDGGNGIINAFGAPPFPIPKDGQEAIWNQHSRPGPYLLETTYDGAAVYKRSNTKFTRVKDKTLAPYQNPKGSIATFDQVIGYKIITTILPKRDAGTITLVHDPLDQITNPRAAWNYMPSTRRVRRAPVTGYDTPAGPGGLSFTDEGRIYNGAIDRYDWKLIGKKELYIPYNNYDLDSPTLSYKEMLTKHHINPEYMRWELHRVWVVEAILKKGQRHVIGKRVFYIDEDSWNATIADSYDGRGELWRTAMQTSHYTPHMPGLKDRLWITSNYKSGDYGVERMVNELEIIENYAPGAMDKDDFTPAAIRRAAKR